MLIENDLQMARLADQQGVDRLMIDLERKRKKARQAGKNLFLSDHTLGDINRVKSVLTQASLVVRINSLHAKSQQEIDQVIRRGADYVMLPYFNHVDEVDTFCSWVDNRAKAVLLVETQSSVQLLPHLADRITVDEIHIGLNDLCLSMGNRSIFQPLYEGLIETCCHMLKGSSKPFGFGGIARLSASDLPVCPDRMLGEQIRLGCSRAWLGRSFRNVLREADGVDQFRQEIGLLRTRIQHWQTVSPETSTENTKQLHQLIRHWEIDHE